MLRSTQLRFVATVVLAMAAASLIAAPARAFSQGNGAAAGDGNAAFGDPDDQVNKAFGLDDKGGEPSSLSSPEQFAPQAGKSNPYQNFQADSLASPHDPFSRPHQ
jgi:hypothetical protein